MLWGGEGTHRRRPVAPGSTVWPEARSRPASRYKVKAAARARALAGVGSAGRRSRCPRAADRPKIPNQAAVARLVLRKPRRHVIRDLRNPLGYKETSNKDVGVGPVELFCSSSRSSRADFEAPTFLVVQYCSKNTGRIKMRKTQPVNRPVHTHQGGCMHVADNSVTFDRFVRHPIAA